MTATRQQTTASPALNHDHVPQVFLQRKCACGTHTTGGGVCSECGKKQLHLQRKFTIGASNDYLELEAERTANQVVCASADTKAGMRPITPIVGGGTVPGYVQRDAPSADDQGDCSGWYRDCESFCRSVANRFWLDIGVTPQPVAVGPVKCESPFVGPDGGLRRGLCLVEYRNGVTVSVATSLHGGKNLDVWQTRLNDRTKQREQTGLACEYRYYCSGEQNTLVLEKKRCYDAKNPPKEPGQEPSSPGIQRSPIRGFTPRQAPAAAMEVLSTPGQPLDTATSRFMEDRFGYDFSRVRVHTDERAAESAGEIAARAYTSGNHIVFGKGQFDPSGQRGRRLLAHELVHVLQQTSAPFTPFLLQREPNQKKKRQDVVIVGEGLKNGEELGRLLSPEGHVIRVRSLGDVAAALAKLKFPIGTIYFAVHSAPNGAMQFGDKEGVIEPAEIAARLKGKISVDNVPDAVDFRGCSVGSSPAAMNRLSAAIGAKSAVAGTCFSIIDRSTPIKIGEKPITKRSDVTAKNRPLFERLFQRTADRFGEKKKCILNRTEEGFFAAGGVFIVPWFNPVDSKEWIPGKSVCYNEISPETVDPQKALSDVQHCRIIRVEAKP